MKTIRAKRIKRIIRQYSKSPSFLEKIGKSLASRIPGGGFSVLIREAARINRKLKTKESRAYLRHFILKYLLGGAPADRLFRQESEACARFVKNLYEYRVEYTPRKYLYHYAPKEIARQVMEQGLLPPYPYRDENGLVFMTYAPRFLAGFLKWKTAMLKEDTDFVLIRIDARRLSEKHKLYYYGELEIVTNRVEPEFFVM